MLSVFIMFDNLGAEKFEPCTFVRFILKVSFSFLLHAKKSLMLTKAVWYSARIYKMIIIIISGCIYGCHFFAISANFFGEKGHKKDLSYIGQLSN